jgi:hypothetical protein
VISGGTATIVQQSPNLRTPNPGVHPPHYYIKGEVNLGLNPRFSVLRYGPRAHISRQFFDLYIVHDPKYHDLRAGGQWTKNINFCVFHTFRWSSTYLCYIPFENAKKSRKSAHPTVHNSRTWSPGPGIALLHFLLGV